jgi:hypothetical protein
VFSCGGVKATAVPDPRTPQAPKYRAALGIGSTGLCYSGVRYGISSLA